MIDNYHIVLKKNEKKRKYGKVEKNDLSHDYFLYLFDNPPMQV